MVISRKSLFLQRAVKPSHIHACGKDLHYKGLRSFLFLLPDVFLALCLGLMMGSLLETILITSLCNSAHLSPVPHCIRVMVLQILGRLVGLRPEPGDVMERPAVQGGVWRTSVFTSAWSRVMWKFLLFPCLPCSTTSHFYCGGSQWQGSTPDGTAGR